MSIKKKRCTGRHCGPTYLMHVEVEDHDLLELVEALQEGRGHR
jgi:hypothetical protein